MKVYVKDFSIAISLRGVERGRWAKCWRLHDCSHDLILSHTSQSEQKCCCRSLLVRCSFVLKVARNHGKRYGELPKAIPCNILKRNLHIHVCVQSLESFPFFQTLASPKAQSDTRSDTLAIPFWYINAHKSILFPHGFPLVEFQLWTRKKRSRDVRHTWPALSKTPKYEPVIIKTDNFNSLDTYIYDLWLMYYHIIRTCPNSVKRYSELRIAIRDSQRAPFCLPLAWKNHKQWFSEAAPYFEASVSWLGPLVGWSSTGM